MSSEGKKYDQDKALIQEGVLEYFPRALEAVARLSEFGASKYGWANWKGLENALGRYQGAMVRHQIDLAKGIEVDPESQVHQHVAVAWNALAVLELHMAADQRLLDETAAEMAEKDAITSPARAALKPAYEEYVRLLKEGYPWFDAAMMTGFTTKEVHNNADK